MKILISAIEPSANLHLKEVLKKLNEKNVNYEIEGVFDKSFGEPIVDSNEFNVMGFFDVLPKIKLAKNTIKKLTKMSKNADKILLIDGKVEEKKKVKNYDKKIKKRYINQASVEFEDEDTCKRDRT
jgi:lipid-A-disaccharide synthase